MTINGYDIRKVYSVYDDDWLGICKDCHYATFFHTPLWAKAFEKWSSGKIKANAVMIEFYDGKKVLLPLSEKTVGPIKIGISMPVTTYGGWISRDKLHTEHAQSLLRYLRKKYKDLLFVENPYDPLLSNVIIHKAIDYSTSTVDLRGGLDKVVEQSKYYHRKNIKTAEKAGVTVQSTEDFSKWQEYYEAYEESIHRWKKKEIFSGVSYDFSLFQILYQLDPNCRKLWVAVLNGKIISGILCFYWNKHAVAWHGAGLSEYFNYRPNNLLYQTAMQHACNAGYFWFDCNPSGGLEGVSSFKQGLGAIRLRTRVIDQKSLIRKIASFLK